jgi:hypothetical protein
MNNIKSRGEKGQRRKEKIVGSKQYAVNRNNKSLEIK